MIIFICRLDMSFRYLTVFLLLIASFASAADSEISVEDGTPKETIYFSAIALYHPIVMYQKYQPLMNYLTQNTPYTFELKLSQDYRDIINFLKSNTVQVALLGGVTYLEAKKEFDVTPILKPVGVD